VDVRIIAATNRDLHHLMEEGKFREDLYYRLCVIPIHIPPLRERREDIIPLVERTMSHLTARTGKAIREVSPAALTALYDYDYPGNVRELRNLLERAFVLCHDEQIDIIHLPADVATAAGTKPGDEASVESSTSGEWPVRLKPSEHKLISSRESRADGAPYPSRRSTEREHMRPEVQRLLDVLDANGWNRGATAGALGISRSTLWRRMKEYGLL
jgi:DNA-binding NtrC family response regulator